MIHEFKEGTCELLDDLDAHHTYERIAAEHRLTCKQAVFWRLDREFVDGQGRRPMISGYFHSAGVRDMQLEVQIDRSNHDVNLGVPCADVNLYLWAPAGFRLIFALTAGEGRKSKR